jgi:hypothetical protein
MEGKGREGKVECPWWTTIMPKRNKAHQEIRPISFWIM